MVISDEGEQVDIRWRLMRYRAAKSGCGCVRVNCGGVPSGIEWFGGKGGGLACQGQVQVAFFSGFALSHVKTVDITMNGFSDHALDEGAFGESKATSVVKAFDAFRMFHHLPPSIFSLYSTLTATLYSQNETVVPDQDAKWRSMDALPRLRLVPAGSDRGAPLVCG